MSNKCSNKCCRGCGLPGKVVKGVVLPLKKCSRCQLVWYHNVDCQRKDYKRHSQFECRLPTEPPSSVPLERTNTTSMPTSPKSIFHVEKQPGKGNCLVASIPLDHGRVILQHDKPLVPPVLRPEHAKTRCALCFGKLHHDCKYRFHHVPQSTHYQVYLCSQACHDVSHSWLALEQTYVYNIVEQKDSSPLPVFATSILLYRIIRQTSLDSCTAEEWNNLHQHEPPPDTAMMCEEELAHLHAVAAFVSCLLSQDTITQKKAHSMDSIHKLLIKIKTNAFCIADFESVALGIGVFAKASFANHSCCPNTIQTFAYGTKGLPPTIQLTVSNPKGIASHQEICISYLDHSAPRSCRQDQLQKSYLFHCSCPRCADPNECTGLKCHSCHAKDFSSNVVALCQNDNDDITYRCLGCQNDNFEAAKDLIHRMNHLFSNQTRTLDESLLFLSLLEKHFWKSSWYYHEFGEQCLQLQLEHLSCCSDPVQQRKLGYDALLLAQDLLRHWDSKNWPMLRATVLQYKCAKLRLFLEPDPRVAVAELNNCLKELLVLYPQNHEAIIELQATLSQAFR